MSEGSSTSSSSLSQDSNTNKPKVTKKSFKLIDFQQKSLAHDLSEDTKLLTETFHGMVMKVQMEINEKSPNDWHLRLNLIEYSETIKEFVSPIIPGYHFPEKDILHCSLVHGKGIIIIIGLTYKTESRNGLILQLLGIFCLFSYSPSTSHQRFCV